MALCSATEVKSFLDISSSSYDTIIASLITYVEGLIQKKTGIRTGATDYVTITDEVVDSRGGLVVYSKYKPIRTISQVERKDANNDWEDYPDEAAGDIDFHEEWNQIYTEYQVAAEGRRMIRLTYTCGYKTAEVPNDLKLLAILMVAGLFNKRQSVGFKQQTILSTSVQLEDGDAEMVRNLIAKYSNLYVY